MIVSLFFTALFSTFISYVRFASSDLVSPKARSALITGTIIFTGVGFLVWFGVLNDQKLDCTSLILLIPLGIAVGARYTEHRNNREDIYVGSYLWHVDFPLFCGVVVLILFRLAGYDLGGEGSFWNFLTETFRNRTIDPQSLDMQTAATKLARENFWYGFSIGALAVQLLVSQVTSVIIAFQAARHSKQP
jgi:hypothetical protein